MENDTLGGDDAAQPNTQPYPTMLQGAPWDAPLLDPEFGNPKKPFPYDGWLAWHWAVYIPKVEETMAGSDVAGHVGPSHPA